MVSALGWSMGTLVEAQSSGNVHLEPSFLGLHANGGERPAMGAAGTVEGNPSPPMCVMGEGAQRGGELSARDSARRRIRLHILAFDVREDLRRRAAVIRS